MEQSASVWWILSRCNAHLIQVLLTDYPDVDLITNLELNARENLPVGDCVSVQVYIAGVIFFSPLICQGYTWGHSVQPLLDALPPGADGFHLIIMSDLVFNHSQVRTARRISRRGY